MISSFVNLLDFISSFSMSYSIKLQSGEEIKVVSSIQDLSHDDHVTSVTIKDLFVFMGRELEDMDYIPAGNILGLYHVLQFFLA